MHQIIRSDRWATVEAQLSAPLASAHLNRIHLPTPMNHRLGGWSGYRLDLALSPRPANARVRYCNRWKPHHFEQVGEVFLLRQDEEVHAKSEAGDATAVVCHLHPNAITQFFGPEIEWTDARLRGALNITSREIKALLWRLARELRAPCFASTVLLELIGAQLAIELQRYCLSPPPPETGAGLTPRRVRIVEERVSQEGPSPTLFELAQLCGLSARQLTRAFRLSMGCSIGAYIRRKQLERAKRLLLSGEAIKAIAHRQGFRSAAGFSYAFRTATGFTPSQFRNTFQQ